MLSYIARTIPLAAVAALCAAASPASAVVSTQPAGAVGQSGDVAAAPGSGAAVAVSFTVRPAIVVVVDDAGTPRELWTNIPGHPAAADLQDVQARRDSPGGAPVAIDPPLRAQLADILAAAAWGHQGLVWHQG